VHGEPLLMRRISGSISVWRPSDAEQLCQLAEQEQALLQGTGKRRVTRYQLFSRLVNNIYTSDERRLPHMLRSWLAQMSIILAAVAILGLAFIALFIKSPSIMSSPPSASPTMTSPPPLPLP